MTEFRMPSLGADMDDGVLVEWRVKVGDRVERGDIVAVVQTQKAAIEVEIFSSGIVESLLVAEGEKVPVGTLLATVAAAADATQGKAPPESKARTPEPEAPVPSKNNRPPASVAWPSGVPDVADPTPKRRPRISPAARRRARELGVDVAALAIGDQPIRLADIEAAAAGEVPSSAQTPSAPKRVEKSVDQTRIDLVRAATAAAMSRAKREIPHYYLSHTIDLEPAMQWLESRNRDRPPIERLLPAALLLKATALALREIPELNGFYRDGSFHPAPAVHLGVGVSLRGGGVVAPAVHDAETLTLPQLMTSLRDLVSRTRSARLRSSELADGTATVSSLGDHGVDTVFGVIYPPQVALIGFGGIATRAWAHEGFVGARRVIRATLAADHRCSEGHRGSLFLRSIEEHLSKPEEL